MNRTESDGKAITVYNSWASHVPGEKKKYLKYVLTHLNLKFSINENVLYI